MRSSKIATGIAFAVSQELVTESCIHCGLGFAIPKEFRARKVYDGSTFYCPGCGKSMVYTETEVQRLKRQLEREKSGREWYSRRLQEQEAAAKHERNRANGYKGQLNRTKKRISHGVCPCCNRTFDNLARHMASKHPDYATGEEGV